MPAPSDMNDLGGYLQAALLSSAGPGSDISGLFHPQSITLLVSSLLDPTHPHSLCSIALDILFRPLHNAIVAKSLHANDARLAVVLRAAMIFFTLPKSKGMLSSVKRHLSTCTCNVQDAFTLALHPPWNPCDETSFFKFIFHLTEVVGVALTDTRPGQLHSRRKGKNDDKQPWPVSEADLLGCAGTCQKTLEIFLLWAEDIPSGCGIFILICGLLNFWEPFSSELHKTPQILILAIGHLQFALAQYAQNRDPSDFRFGYPLFSVGNLVQPPLSPGDETSIDNVVTPHYSAFTIMAHIRNENKCMNAGCPAILGTKTSPCSRCGIIRYCGSTCQRNAWRDQRAPHKALCDSIHSLRCVLGLQGATEWNSWVCYYTRQNPGGDVTMQRKVEFSALCEVKRADEANSEKITNTIELLTQLCKT
ncbi:hypothetical protein FB451DRAFT_1362039 [Mycena latifolia]|nr:hypothetical protein FB451DRAFT_1362039 [Mycena latifolia]